MSTARVALVTGASRRIGRGIAQRLHADGFAVCLHYHTSKEDAEALAAEFNAVRSGSAHVVGESLCANTPSDMSGGSLSLEERCKRLLDSCYSHFGRCDVLVNNASAYYPTPLLAKEGDKATVSDDAADIFGSNALAPFYLIRFFAQRAVASAAAPPTAPESNYCVVNVVDAMTNQPLLGFTAYTMAKHALEGLTKSAALELAPHRIRVTAVGPGLSCLPVAMTDEERAEYRLKVPLGQREASADEIAAAVSFMVSDQARYITGSSIAVDGGWSLTRT